MEDLEKLDKQIEIFCAFIIDFEQLKETVSSMLKSGETDEFGRVQRIKGIITEYITGANSVDEILARLPLIEGNARINRLINYMTVILSKDKQRAYNAVLSNYVELKEVIASRPRERILSGIEEMDEMEIITADPSVPISKADLNFLNWIGKLSLNNTKELNEANKEFKSINFKTRLNELYCTKAYYFEQVFSNTDVKIQRKLLDIINSYHKNHGVSDEERNAYKSLVDINILSDIDNLANKTSSNVSDHQAFEAFAKILKRNTNHKLIKSVLKENIIMTAMFKTNSSTIGNHYGLRKLFENAHFPYNKVVIKRYMQLMEKNDDSMKKILLTLNRDEDFRRVYEGYLKSSRTKMFKDFADALLEKLHEDIVSNDVTENLLILLDGFIKRDAYTHEILPQEEVLEMLDQVYYYLVRNELLGSNEKIESKIKEFFNIRVTNELVSNKNIYHVKKHSIIYSITPGDIWYKIHSFIKEFQITHIQKFFLKYNEISVYSFKIGEEMEHLDEDFDHSKLKGLPNDELVVVCANMDKQIFDRYSYALFNRLIRSMFKDAIHIQVKSVTGGAFRKKESPGLEKNSESRVRKTLVDYLTLYTLMGMDEELFINVYKRKADAVLQDIHKSTIPFEEIQQFVQVKYLPDLINIYNNNATVNRLITKFSRFNAQTEPQFVFDHANKFFSLIQVESEEEG